MILLVGKESSVYFQQRFSQYLAKKNIPSEIMLLQPFDEFHAQGIDCLKFGKFDELFKIHLRKNSNELKEILSKFLSEDDFKKLSKTQWLNKELNRIQFRDVNNHDCLVYLSVLAVIYENHLLNSKATILLDTDNDNFARRLLFRICICLGVKYLVIQHTRYEDRIFVSRQSVQGFCENLKQSQSQIDELKLSNIRKKFIRKYSLVNEDDKKISNLLKHRYKQLVKYSLSQLLFALRLTFFYLKRKPPVKIKSHIFPRVRDTWRFNFATLLKLFKRQEKISGCQPHNGYVYMPLSVTTEGMDSFASGDFSDEKFGIKILKSLCKKYGLKLYIRDHPHMLMERSDSDEAFFATHSSYYENSMVALQTDSRSLIQNADYVVTLNGTSSLEAKIFGIPAFTMGQSYHDYVYSFSNINHCEKKEKLQSRLNYFLSNRSKVLEHQNEQIRQFLSFVELNSFPYNYVSILRGVREANEEELFDFICREFY